MLHGNRLAIYLVFFIESAVLGTWIPRIPDIKHQLDLTDSALGLCLFAMASGTILSFVTITPFIGRTGLRTACQWSLPAWALAFTLPALAGSVEALFIMLLLAGLSVGAVEVSMNAMASALEKRYRQRMMSKCHGFWSLGSMAGALSSAFIARLEVPVLSHFLVVMPLLAVFGLVAASWLPRGLGDVPADSTQRTPISTRLARLKSGLLLLCLMPIGVMIVEGAFIDWSAVFMRDVMQASPMIIGVTYAFFSVVMAVTRLSGDYLAARFGEVQVIRLSGVCAASGIGAFALAGSLPIAFIGAVLSGLGTAIVYPLSVSAAANRTGSVTDNVAAISLVSFTAFLLAPPAIGWLSDQAGMRVALLMIVPLALTTSLLATQAAGTD